MVHCPTRHYNPSPGLCGELCCFTGKKNTRKFGEYLLLVDNCALDLASNKLLPKLFPAGFDHYKDVEDDKQRVYFTLFSS